MKVSKISLLHLCTKDFIRADFPSHNYWSRILSYWYFWAKTIGTKMSNGAAACYFLLPIITVIPFLLLYESLLSVLLEPYLPFLLLSSPGLPLGFRTEARLYAVERWTEHPSEPSSRTWRWEQGVYCTLRKAKGRTESDSYFVLSFWRL